MTVHRLLSEASSAELTEWFVFLRVKQEREDDARESAAFQRKIESGG